MLEKPFIALEHVVPIEDRQSGDLDPPADPAFLRRIERQRRRDFAAIDEFGQDGLAIGSSERARGISIVTRLHRRACDHAQKVAHDDRRLLSHGCGGLGIRRRAHVAQRKDVWVADMLHRVLVSTQPAALANGLFLIASCGLCGGETCNMSNVTVVRFPLSSPPTASNVAVFATPSTATRFCWKYALIP